jgi:hypothetical protein
MRLLIDESGGSFHGGNVLVYRVHLEASTARYTLTSSDNELLTGVVHET